jgi:hypothetical protein
MANMVELWIDEHKVDSADFDNVEDRLVGETAISVSATYRF